MQAVAYIPSDNYDTWLRVGMALHSTGQPWAREVWDTWSQHSPKYDGAKQDKSWRSFDEDRDKKATLGTLFYLAQQAGWQPPRRAIPDMTQAPAGTMDTRPPVTIGFQHRPPVLYTNRITPHYLKASGR
jgi:hypothetical protein